jgi:uncharacterized membrane protein YccC
MSNHPFVKGYAPRSAAVSTLQPHTRRADALRVWVLIPLLGFLLGLAVARWWVVVTAAAFGAYILRTNELEGSTGTWVALVLSTLLACAIACGVALRRLRNRA